MFATGTRLTRPRVRDDFSLMPLDLCEASLENPWTRPPNGCVVVPSICFEAEQLVLHGPEATAALPQLMKLLNSTRDPSDVFSKLRPTMRPTVVVDPPPDTPYQYLPLATGAKRVPKRLRSRFLRTHTPSSPTHFSSEVAIAFFTSWSNSFTEIFSRAVVRLFELWCALIATGVRREQLHLRPAMWGSDWGPDYAAYWLRPFSSLPVEQFAATPQRELVKIIWRGQATVEQFQRYANLSAQMMAKRVGPRCFRRAFVCDFTGMPWAHTLHPWSSVQMIAAHHGGTAQHEHTKRAVIPRMRACSNRLAASASIAAAAVATGGGATRASSRRLAANPETKGSDASSRPGLGAADREARAAREASTAADDAIAAASTLVQLNSGRTGVTAEAGAEPLAIHTVHRLGRNRRGAGTGTGTGANTDTSAGPGSGTGIGTGGSRGAAGGCPLNIVFADRRGRRKLRNLADLVQRCAEWSPAARRNLRVNCSAHNFGVGLIRSLPTLRRADVLVVSHGADVINGFGLHAGASVIEVMPVHQAGCPCDMYRRMYTYQGPRVFHYQMWSTNASNAVSTEPRKRGTYHSDLHLPWGSLQTALEQIVQTSARRRSYRFRRFPY